jgi:hypothetical protein
MLFPNLSLAAACRKHYFFCGEVGKPPVNESAQVPPVF